MLAWTIYISFLGAAGLLLLPRGSVGAARILALLTAIAGFAITLTVFVQHRTGEMLTITRVPWVPSLGIEYHLAADGISLTLLLLTGIIAITGVLFSWDIEDRAKEFFALFLLLIGAVYGVFLSYDLFLLFVFYEIVIVPKYFLIAIWGSTRREYGAMKLALYSFAGSAMVLIGLIAAYVAAGARSTSLGDLAGFPFSLHFQMAAFPLVFVGFAVLAGMWPLHTWAPTGHVAAPTAASMLLAGVVMKLGAYGCLRVAMTLFPLGLGPWGFHVMGLGSWRDVFALLAVIGIIYGGLVALVQKDFKFVIGYSSVSHMGFILLGLMTLNQLGLSGAVLQMFSHGVLAGLLFAVVGRMVYARTHTRDLAAPGRDGPQQGHSVCRSHLCYCRDGQHGPAWVQRVLGGVDGPGGRLARVSHVCGLRGIRHRGWRRIHLARDAKGIFRGGGNRVRNAGSAAAADHDSRTSGRDGPDRRERAGRTLSAGPAECHPAGAELSAV